ncbi:MAG: ABC transporter permease, partial [Clostridiaceae bacterium]|nr:ABC transporter permease [Clostridiaceae bacterium]
QPEMIAPSAVIGRIFSGHQLSGVFILAVIAVAVVAFVVKYTKFGFHMRTVGFNRLAAETAGINYKRMTIVTMFLSAGIAGLCGAGQIMGVHYRFIDNFSSGYGFEGIAVAALAANNPAAVLISGILFGGIKAGAMSVNRIANIPMDYISIIQALVIVFIAAPRLISQIVEAVSGIFKKRRRVAS